MLARTHGLIGVLVVGEIDLETKNLGVPATFGVRRRMARSWPSPKAPNRKRRDRRGATRSAWGARRASLMANRQPSGTFAPIKSKSLATRNVLEGSRPRKLPPMRARRDAWDQIRALLLKAFATWDSPQQTTQIHIMGRPES